MSKKLTIIGRGTVGALSVAHFLRYTDWQIDWVFDEEISPVSVGEATNLILPRDLNILLGLQHNDLIEIGGTVKQGVYKKYWGSGSDFLHPFPMNNSAIHFTANKLHNKIFNIVKENKRVNITNKNVKDPYSLDSDFIMICSGIPESLNSKDFKIIKSIPVNSAYIKHSEWKNPQFNYSLTNAMKHGWVFGIPLQKKISIGYLFNSDISSTEDIKEDILNVFKEYELNVFEKDFQINFKSFYRKNNFDNRVVYNGNASFFLEPLEATSTGFSSKINRLAWDLWNNNTTKENAQIEYERYLHDIELMILLHYMSGSIYKNEFWKNAKEKAKLNIQKEIEKNTIWANFIFHIVNDYPVPEEIDVGSWPPISYKINIEKLGIKEELKKMF